MRILLATDGTEEAIAARHFLTCLPPEGITEVCTLTVLASPSVWVGPYLESFYAGPQTMERLYQEEQRAARQVAEQEAQALRRRGFAAQAQVRGGAPADTILEVARQWNADLIVLGHRARSGVEEFILGSVASGVARRADRPVLIARAPQHGLRRAILATDGSPNAQRAIQFAARLPLPPETQFVLVTVVKPYRPFPGLLPTDRERFEASVREVREAQRKAAAALVEEAKEPLAAAGRAVTTAVRQGDPAAEIVAVAAEQEADLVIAGARGVTGLRGLLLGSVADQLLRRAEGSVLIVH